MNDFLQTFAGVVMGTALCVFVVMMFVEGVMSLC